MTKEEYMKIYAKIMKFDKEPLTEKEQTDWIAYHYDLENDRTESLKKIAEKTEASAADVSNVLSGLKDSEVSKDWTGFAALKSIPQDDTKIIKSIEENRPQAEVKLQQSQTTNMSVLSGITVFFAVFLNNILSGLFKSVERV